MFKREVVIDGKGHLLGRLASIIAKEILNGQRIVCVRCEEINISGSLYRNKLKYQKFLRLRMNSNPRRGPFHLRAPSNILWRTVRGMLPHKIFRGKCALERLRVFEGMPAPYDKKKKLVVPGALKVLKLRQGRDNCRLGDLSSKVGWSYDPLIARLETKRKVFAESYHQAKKALNRAKSEADAEAQKQLPAEWQNVLAAYT